MLRLLLLRHAAAEPFVSGHGDHERPLSARGRAALPQVAVAVERCTGEVGRALDAVVGSTALRVRETASGVLPVPRSLEPEHFSFEPALYLAGADELLDRLRQTPAAVETLLLCGHNPGLHQLALVLLGGRAPRRLRDGLPTAGLVVLDTTRPWSQLGDHPVSLQAFSTPDKH